MVFFIEITQVWQKSQDFWFANFFLEIFKIHRLVWIFLCIFSCFESVSTMFCFELLLILNLTNLWMHICIIGWWLVLQRNPYGFKNLNPSKKPATMTRQLTKSIDFRQNYLCDFHLWSVWKTAAARKSNICVQHIEIVMRYYRQIRKRI